MSAGRVGEPVAAPEPETPKGPPEPPAFRFSARMPNISALDLEVVKLTALFVAKRGKSFMTALSQRETRNFQFDFLRPQHSLYQFFTRLVDQYKELFQIDVGDGPGSEANRLAELKKNTDNKYHILDRAMQRAEWVKYQEKQRQKEEEEEEQEKIAYAQIDWHDFVVVETVLFSEADDQAELPPPTSLNDLQSASLEQKAMMSLQPHTKRIEEAMPTEDDTNNYYNAFPPTSQVPTPQPQFTVPAPVPAPFPQPPGAIPVAAPTDIPPQQPSPFPIPSHTPTPISATPTPVPISAAAEEEERQIRERTEARDRAHAAQAAAKATPTPPPGPPGQPPMRIRSDYVPRAQAKRLHTSGQTTLCPNCRQQIPVNEIDHHMRVELLDPRWKEQRAKAEARYASTNLSTNDVFNNLKRLASQRTDVFDPLLTNHQSATTAAGAAGGAAPAPGGADGQPAPPGVLDPEEEARRKRAATGAGIPGMPAGVPGYDGSGPPGPATLPHPPPPQSVNIEEQIRQIHQKFKQ